MAYEYIYNKELAKKLSKAKSNDQKVTLLHSELKDIADRAIVLDSASKELKDSFTIILEILSKAFPTLDLKDPNLTDTPGRVARSWIEMISGLGVNEKEIFSTSFPSEKYDQLVILRGIKYTSLCSHHFLPFTGEATIGYLPNIKKGKICGISKLARVVDVYAKRPQLQERMCSQILEAVEQALKPRGAICVVTGHHHCMSCRGVEKQGTDMITSAISGDFKDSGLKFEFFELLKVHK